MTVIVMMVWVPRLFCVGSFNIWNLLMSDEQFNRLLGQMAALTDAIGSLVISNQEVIAVVMDQVDSGGESEGGSIVDFDDSGAPIVDAL